MVYRIFVEKKAGLRHEADHLKEDIVSFLQIKSLKDLRLVNRYDVENITEELFKTSVSTVFFVSSAIIIPPIL